MATRRDAREWVCQLLFQLDMNPDKLENVFPPFWSERQADAKSREFAEAHVRGVREHLEEIDRWLRRFTEHWDMERIGRIEKNVMRMAIYEMLYCPEIPSVVSINEAVDIAKYFCTRESGKFVNGILDHIRQSVDTGDGRRGPPD
jgi:N utilization substance protein B